MLVQLETTAYLSDRLQKIQIKKMIGWGRYGQRDEDKLGIAGAHTHRRLVLVEECTAAGLGAEPMLAVKISISCGAELAFSPGQCSIYLIFRIIFSSPALHLYIQHQHECRCGSAVSVTGSHHYLIPFIMHEKYNIHDLPHFQDNAQLHCTCSQCH